MTDNIVLQYFIKGGWIMWPILITSIVAFSVIIERIIWWARESRRREVDKLDQVYGALENGDRSSASSYSRNATDPRLRVIWHGLNHHHSSLQGALQVAAGIELKRAGRFIVVLDTIVTLAPLLGLLGTVTGLMKAFFKLGNVELSEQAIGGGIAEALIATASGLFIAVLSLIALNYFGAKLAEFQFELQTAATNAEVLVGSAVAKDKESQKESLAYETRLSAAA
jgi:biopolymer transport protein ExbB